MILAVSSSSAALKVLQTGVPADAASGQQEQDPLRRFLDPRSALALPSQSFDALLQLRTQLRQDQVHEPQAQQGASLTSGKVTPDQSGMLAWVNKGTPVRFSYLDQWTKQMESLKARSTETLNSPLMPWNSPDVIQQLKDLDAHAISSEAREREFRASDSAIYRSMAETPPEDMTRIKAMGGEIWYERTQTYDRISDKEFFRNIKNEVLYGSNLTDPIDPSNETAQALLNGTAQIIRASKIPELQYKSSDYSVYALNSEINQYKWIAGWGRTDYDTDYLRGLEKKNPSMEVSFIIWTQGDAAFILSPKTASVTPTSTAIAKSSVTGTGTKPAAASAR